MTKTEWDALNTVQIKMKLVKSTDADILEYLNSLANKQGYIKALIRNDIRKTKSSQESSQDIEKCE